MSDKKYYYNELSSDVLIVAIETVGLDWSAYIGAVPGQCHEDEYMIVAESGCKTPQKIGEYYFPFLAKKLPWRN